MNISIIKLPEILQQTSKSRSGLYNDIKKGLFPRPFKLGIRSSGWANYEITEIVNATIAGLSESQIKELVKRLEADRKHSMQQV